MPTTADYLTQLKADKDTLFDNLYTMGAVDGESQGQTKVDTFTALVKRVLNVPTSGWYWCYPSYYEEGTLKYGLPTGCSSIETILASGGKKTNGDAIQANTETSINTYPIWGVPGTNISMAPQITYEYNSFGAQQEVTNTFTKTVYKTDNYLFVSEGYRQLSLGFNNVNLNFLNNVAISISNRLPNGNFNITITLPNGIDWTGISSIYFIAKETKNSNLLIMGPPSLSGLNVNDGFLLSFSSSTATSTTITIFDTNSEITNISDWAIIVCPTGYSSISDCYLYYWGGDFNI